MGKVSRQEVGAADPLAGDYFIGSADWMERNLSDRVEPIAPVQVPALRQRLWDILQLLLHDQRQAWELWPDGSYVQRHPRPATRPRSSAAATATCSRT
jgi:polyphosphate kinase